MSATAPAIPVPIRRRPPEDVAARAHAVLDAALSVADLWQASPAAALAAVDLHLAHEGFRSLHGGGGADAGALADRASDACMAMAFLLLAIAEAAGRELAGAIRDVAAATQDQAGPQMSPAGRADATAPQP
jgi:hypothetical protein